MTDATAKRLARVLFTLCCLFYLADILVPLLARARAGRPIGAGVGWVDLALLAMSFSFPLAGIMIARRQPANRFSWLLLTIGLVFAVPTDPYIEYGLRLHPGTLPGAELVAGLSAAEWAPALGLVATFPVLLFPDGHLPSPRWRWVGWFSGLSIAWVYLLITVMPGKLEVGGAPAFDNPLGIDAPGRLPEVLLPTIVVLPISFLMCAAGLVRRFRRSTGVERLQLKWLASAGAVVAGVYLFAMVSSLVSGLSASGDGDPAWLLRLQNLAVLSFCLIPLSIAVAILKHGLYEIDVVINKALVFGTLASFITAVYVGIVVGVGSLTARGNEPNLALSIAATAVVAVAFQPVRDRVQRLANRLVYGARATPYEVLSDLADRVGGSYETAQLLPMMARTVAEGVGARRVEVWLGIESALIREAVWTGDGEQDQELVGATASVRDLQGARVVPVRHQGEVLGALVVTKPPGEALTPAEGKLLDDVAGQAGLVLRNVRLVEDLRGSRQRLVSTQDEERRRLERNLHDGAQQSLVSVALMIRAVRARLGGKNAVVGAGLDAAADQLALAIEELRELARGIHPAILTDRGLGPGIRSLAERSPVPVVVEYELLHRPGPAVEATLYFVVAEALKNAAKYSQASQIEVRVVASHEAVELTVADDGIGGADASRGSGLRGLSDRAAVVDGTLAMTSGAGTGTTLTCRIPVAVGAGLTPLAVVGESPAVPVGPALVGVER